MNRKQRRKEQDRLETRWKQLKREQVVNDTILNKFYEITNRSHAAKAMMSKYLRIRDRINSHLAEIEKAHTYYNKIGIRNGIAALEEVKRSKKINEHLKKGATFVR